MFAPDQAPLLGGTRPPTNAEEDGYFSSKLVDPSDKQEIASTDYASKKVIGHILLMICVNFLAYVYLAIVLLVLWPFVALVALLK